MSEAHCNPKKEQSSHDMVSQTSEPTSSAEPSQHSYAFLVHSADTLTNNLPPNVDNKPLARQKRRRTSPEDQAILETEYLRNPKPDKAARMQIVSRVALGEKEVQIWFQNRRQSSRRKSRPLLPHEIAHYQSSHPIPFEMSSPTETRVRLHSRQSDLTGAEAEELRQEDALEDMIPSSQPEESSAPIGDLDQAAVASTPSNFVPRAETSFSQAPPSSQDSVHGRLGYLANRRSAAPPRPSAETQYEPPSVSQRPQVEDQERPSRELRKSSSFVRLSMTADGNAKIITHESSSPSPPRKAPAPPSSSAPAAFLHNQGSDTPSKLESSTPDHGGGTLRRKPSGRSRDSRAWEFWCDKDARSELEEKAEQEASGSAADAIGLIRSNSGRGILQSLTGKRESPRNENPSSKRPRIGKVPLLQRSASLQNRQPRRSTFGDKASMTPRRFKKAASGLGIQIPATDSDKENWSPERVVDDMEEPDLATAPIEKHRPGRRPVKPVQELDHSSPDSIMGALGQEEDEDIAHFVARGRKSQSASEEEELDCVQGLLSLSQGNWR